MSKTSRNKKAAGVGMPGKERRSPIITPLSRCFIKIRVVADKSSPSTTYRLSEILWPISINIYLDDMYFKVKIIPESRREHLIIDKREPKDG